MIRTFDVTKIIELWLHSLIFAIACMLANQVVFDFIVKGDKRVRIYCVGRTVGKREETSERIRRLYILFFLLSRDEGEHA